MNNPCYDTSTKTHCPDRHVGCASECERWKTYAKQRDDNYKKRLSSSRLTVDRYHVKEKVIKKYEHDRRR